MSAKVKDRSAKSRGLKLVSFEIEPELWQAFRIQAILEDKTSSALLRDLIKIELKGKKEVYKKKTS